MCSSFSTKKRKGQKQVIIVEEVSEDFLKSGDDTKEEDILGLVRMMKVVLHSATIESVLTIFMPHFYHFGEA